MSAARTLLVGGLGRFHDPLVAAAFRAHGQSTMPLPELDRAALERGRAALPRGQCAPLLYTTGALLAAVGAAETPLAYLSLSSCGPCRYALFELAWARAVTAAYPDADLGFVRLDQCPLSMTERLGSRALLSSLEAIVAADAIAEQSRRLAPRVVDPNALDAAITEVVAAIAAEIAEGSAPLDALRTHADWHRALALAPPRPLARVALVGEPWSLHVDGDGQLHLPRLLGAAGAEVEVPGVALFIAYVLWHRGAVRWGRKPLDPSAERAGRTLSQFVTRAVRDASAATGLDDFELPDFDELAELAAPFLPASLLGGYGHIEVALAARARRDRRAHAVVSVKSFGCIPSSGISDGILPTVLGDLPFLALEICGDGDAARESRLMMRVAAARERAASELADACRRAGCDASAIPAGDPLAGFRGEGPRPYACTLACNVVRGLA